MEYARIIQGGMGVAVSSWRLANAVSAHGQLGVVSGTALDVVLCRRLQNGDPGGHLHAAMSQFPIPEVAERIWDRYFIPGGIGTNVPYKSKPIHSLRPPKLLEELMLVASFVEVWLARRGHSGPVGMNLLEKIQLPTLPTLYGAMLAGVQVILMGAGIPRAIPGLLRNLARGERAEQRLDVLGGEAKICFDPKKFGFGEPLPQPKFFGIVASASLAQLLAKKCDPGADGFVVEGPSAGGHNAPPRGSLVLSERGEPVYSDRDLVDLEKLRELGLPFWMAGSYGSNRGLQEAIALGAQGVQVGTAFAFCDESGFDPDLKSEVLRRCASNQMGVFTDPKASPTGFPFKVASVQGSLSDASVAAARNRVCDLGFLRQCYQGTDGKIGFRCPAEPVEDYVRKGGDPADCEGRVCVCNGLLAAIGLGQQRRDFREPALVTAGDDLAHLKRFLGPSKTTYTAADVIDSLLGDSVTVC